jgi:hypothetical protein
MPVDPAIGMGLSIVRRRTKPVPFRVVSRQIPHFRCSVCIRAPVKFLPNRRVLFWTIPCNGDDRRSDELKRDGNEDS